MVGEIIGKKFCIIPKPPKIIFVIAILIWKYTLKRQNLSVLNVTFQLVTNNYNVKSKQNSHLLALRRGGVCRITLKFLQRQ